MDVKKLEPLNRLVGTWTTEATHPAFPGVIVRGTAVVEWLEGERFLIHRARTDYPDFPDSISIIGFTNRDRVEKAAGTNPPGAGEGEGEGEGEGDRQLTMNYFDSRGVSRVLEVAVDNESWRILRESPGFSQRFTGTFADAGNTIAGVWQLRQDDVHWRDDLRITYRRGG